MRTGALVCPVTIETSASIEAGFGVTLVDVVLAVAPGEAWRAQTRESVDAVHTGAAIEAGAAEKQINIMYETSKSKYSAAYLEEKIQI